MAEIIKCLYARVLLDCLIFVRTVSCIVQKQPERENVYILMEVRILSALFFNFRILTKS